ncbi:MAG: hypothetical protein LBH14_07210 [Desulfobulbaceae bacterium]|jgi:hypothetical protein|nr:hypothetical protein [Desulfobulbaceae bacterium]
MQFNPLKFQMPLATGGIALMAFNYLEFAVPNVHGMVTLHDMLLAKFTTAQLCLNWILVALMLIFSLLTIAPIPLYLWQWCKWRGNKEGYGKFMAEAPTVVVAGCVPYASLAMTGLVVLAPVAFFIPALSSNIQAMMLPGLLFFALLWLGLFSHEFKILKKWLTQPTDMTKLHFVWLLDAFSFGLVSLIGTGVAAMSENGDIAAIAAFGAFFTVIFGSLLLVAKLAYLVFLQMRAEVLPGKNFLPAYFLIVPISCLYGFSMHRLAFYVQAHFHIDMAGLLFATFVIPYVIAIFWSAFCLYLLWDYIRNDFLKSDFAAPQWSMV